MVKACIFDLDGVVCDTAHYHYLAWKKLANHLGFDFTEEQNEKMKGISRMDSLDILLGIGGITPTEGKKIKYAHVKNEWYVESLEDLDHSVLITGVVDLLKELRANNIKIALGSASKNARKVLSSLNLNPYFDAIVDGNDVEKSKPDPEVFLKAAKLLGVKPEEAVVFEDSYKGIEAANTGGFMVIGVGTPEDLDNTDHHISSFEGFTIQKMNNLLTSKAV